MSFAVILRRQASGSLQALTCQSPWVEADRIGGTGGLDNNECTSTYAHVTHYDNSTMHKSACVILHVCMREIVAACPRAPKTPERSRGNLSILGGQLKANNPHVLTQPSPKSATGDAANLGTEHLTQETVSNHENDAGEAPIAIS